MTEKEKFIFEWNNIVDNFYEYSNDFEYKECKSIIKEFELHRCRVEKRKIEILNSLEMIEFNENEVIKNEIINTLNFLKEHDDFLKSIPKLEPKTKYGYYNYFKQIIAFL